MLAQAVALHQAGRTSEAAAIYEGIIAKIPDHFDATHLLGVIALQEGRFDQAQLLIESALRINPRDSAAHNNLGTVHLRTRSFASAQEHFRRAVELQPKSIDARTNLGLVMRELGRPREALEVLRAVHSEDPGSATVCNLLGACLLDTGDAQEAIEYFEAATRSAPMDGTSWGNLSVALNRVGDQDRAAECAGKAIALSPDSSSALAALAASEFEQGLIESAIENYRQAVALPDPSPQMLCAFADALWISGRCDEAFEQLRQALAIDVDNAPAMWKLAMSQCQPFYGAIADIEPSRRAFARHLDALQSWFRSAARPESYAVVGTTQPFFLAYQPLNNRELLRQYGALCSEWMESLPPPAAAGRRSKSARRGSATMRSPRIRVGIASAHIRDHSVWNAITKGWVRHLDKSRYEVWLFHLGRTVDGETAGAKADAAHFEGRPKDLAAGIQAIAAAELDVLIYPEIGMDALTTQLAALRLAPVQAASWGHPETTGLPTMDLYLSADALEPTDAQANYSERLVRLPNLGVYLEPLTPSIASPDLRALGLPEDEPLLLCPGMPFKYSPAFDHVWARIAKGLQGPAGGWGRIARRLRGKGPGKLVFFRSGNDSMDQLLAQRLRRAFDAERVGFDAHVRVIPYLDRTRFFGLMQRATLMLDTVGFSGFNLALQAVEAGLPVLAYEGAFMRGRLASGIMRRLELAELVAGSAEEFIQAAVSLAADAPKCHALREEIAKRRDRLFHDLAPVRALEDCLQEAVRATRVAPA